MALPLRSSPPLLPLLPPSSPLLSTAAASRAPLSPHCFSPSCRCRCRPHEAPSRVGRCPLRHRSQSRGCSISLGPTKSSSPTPPALSSSLSLTAVAEQYFVLQGAIRRESAMMASRLASLLRRSKTLNQTSHLGGPSAAVAAANGASASSSSSLLIYSRFAASRTYGGSTLARCAYSYGLKSLPKVLFGTSSRKMSTWISSKAEITNSGVKLLVTEGPHAQKIVGIWLFGCAAWVFSLVVLGGITRLTRSGLSMTDWKFTGNLPPLSEDQWLLEFEKYQLSPEYKRVNKGMGLDDFKFIYWMEYAHRMWGRALGVVFALPCTCFLVKGYITRPLGLRLSSLFALGAGQGLIGWWMVKSGLEEPASEYVQPRVSPYRLATHLTSAFVIYCGILWTALSVVMPEPPSGTISWLHGAAKARKLAIPISVIVGITAISGAFVAGNDAGHAYNTFPKMGDSWIPDDILIMEPFVRNFFENTSTVQFNHRILATTTLISVGGLWLACRKLDIHPAVRSLIGSTLGMATLQVTLGISTLLSYVPVSLASAHQAGALTLLTLMILLTHCVRKPSPVALKSLASLPKSMAKPQIVVN